MNPDTVGSGDPVMAVEGCGRTARQLYMTSSSGSRSVGQQQKLIPRLHRQRLQLPSTAVLTPSSLYVFIACKSTFRLHWSLSYNFCLFLDLFEAILTSSLHYLMGRRLFRPSDGSNHMIAILGNVLFCALTSWPNRFFSILSTIICRMPIIHHFRF